MVRVGGAAPATQAAAVRVVDTPAPAVGVAAVRVRGSAPVAAARPAPGLRAVHHVALVQDGRAELLLGLRLAAGVDGGVPAEAVRAAVLAALLRGAAVDARAIVLAEEEELAIRLRVAQGGALLDGLVRAVVVVVLDVPVVRAVGVLVQHARLVEAGVHRDVAGCAAGRVREWER